jgi:5-methylcytosine-specific restriction protein A
MIWPYDSLNALQPAAAALHTVTLVCGPPLAGKSTYVKQHAAPGDIIVDTDLLGCAISGMSVHDTPATLKPFLFAMRDAVLAQLRVTVEPRRVWVVETASDPDLRARLRSKWLASEVIVLLTPVSVCRARLLASPRPRRVDWIAAVENWWNSYKPARGETQLDTYETSPGGRG